MTQPPHRGDKGKEQKVDSISTSSCNPTKPLEDLTLEDLSDNPHVQRLQNRILKLERENQKLRQQILLEKSRAERLQDIQWRYERIVEIVMPLIQNGSITLPE
jgi:hypothetical protein